MDSGSYPPDLTVCKAATREGSGFFTPMDGRVALGRPCPSRHSYILYIVCRERQDAGVAIYGRSGIKCHIDTILALHYIQIALGRLMYKDVQMSR